jgi:hypothetical protein
MSLEKESGANDGWFPGIWPDAINDTSDLLICSLMFILKCPALVVVLLSFPVDPDSVEVRLTDGHQVASHFKAAGTSSFVASFFHFE